MSESIKTERYRLALIAHYAEKLAELVREQSDDGSCVVILPIHYLVEVVREINEYLNKEEANG